MGRGAVILSWFCCASSFAMDFSAPLQNVQYTLSNMGGTVTYQVFDPGRGIFVTGGTNTPAGYISTPTTNGGVVAWLAGTTVHYRIYDPGRGNWMASSFAGLGNPITDPVSDSGIVAWLANKAVCFAVYDPVLNGWKQAALQMPATAFVSTPKNSGGMVVWSADQTVYYLTYNPVVHEWAWASSAMGTYISDIEVSSGVAAWLAGNTAYYVVYDLGRSAWRGGVGGGGFVSSVAIANSTVSWVVGTPGTTSIAGYTYTNGAWTTGIQTPAHAAFAVSTNAGNAPLFVWFTDLSLGGTSWGWNFGDGNTVNGRTPYHVFSGFGGYAVLQTVAGPTGSSTASTNILTDLSAPSGSMVINNDDPYARSNSVTLNLSVTDNSGAIIAMRFSNTNSPNFTNYTAWVPYATNYPWTLTSGDGVKSVYGQFMDPSSNISLTIHDSITLDSRPPPLVFITNYFVPESTPTLQVDVFLSDSSVFPISVDFATADGTATSLSDYGSTNGRLRFNPGITNLSFTISITNDALVELNETLFVAFSNPTNATVGSPGTITILDDDLPTVSFSTNTFKVDENGVQAVVTASLNTPSGLTLRVNYASSNGTATAGSDYNAVSGTLIFSPGQTSRTFNVPILDDFVDEPDETVRLFLSSPTNAVLGLASATLLIIDDDYPPASFTTNQFFVSEASGSANVSVKLNTPFAQTVYVDYATSDGSAHAGSDYFPASGRLIFAPGETNHSFSILILSDSVTEPDETVLISLTGMINATAGLYTNATLTIMDDGARLGAFSWNAGTGSHATLSGPTGRNYAIEASSNLVQWSEITRVTNTTGTVSFTDSNATSLKKRFYRAKQTN